MVNCQTSGLQKVPILSWPVPVSRQKDYGYLLPYGLNVLHRHCEPSYSTDGCKLAIRAFFCIPYVLNGGKIEISTLRKKYYINATVRYHIANQLPYLFSVFFFQIRYLHYRVLNGHILQVWPAEADPSLPVRVPGQDLLRHALLRLSLWCHTEAESQAGYTLPRATKKLPSPPSYRQKERREQGND